MGVEQALDPVVDADRDGHACHDALAPSQLEVVLRQLRVPGVVVRPAEAAARQDAASEPPAGLDPDGVVPLEPRPVPVPEHHRVAARLAQRHPGEVRAAERAGRHAEPLEHVVQLERGVDLARQLGEGLRLAPALLAVLEQAGVLERERRVVGEGLRQADLVAVEAPALHVADGDRADGGALDQERHRQDRAVGRLLDPRVERGRQRDPRIGQDVRRDDRPALADGEPHRAGVLGEHDVEPEGVPGARAEDEGAPLRVQAADDRGLRAEQPPEALRGAPRHLLRVERLGEQAPDVAEHLGFPSPPGRLGVQAGVLEGHRGLVGEGLGEPDLVRLERARGLVAHDQRPDDDVVDEQREREHGPVARALDAAARLRRERDPRVGEDVVGRHRLAVADREPGRRRTRGEPLVPLDVEPDAREECQLLGLLLKAVERGHAGAREPADARDDARDDVLGLERLGDEASRRRRSASWNRRAFSIAIAAWLARRERTSSSRSVNGRAVRLWT